MSETPTETTTYPGPLQGWPPGSAPPPEEGTAVIDPSAVLPDCYEDAKADVYRIATPGNDTWVTPPLDPYPEEVARLEALAAEQEAVDRTGGPMPPVKVPPA